MLGSHGSRKAPAWKDLDPAELREWLGQGVRPRLVDVREADELAGPLGHIEGIEHVPLATVAAACRAWPRDELIVVVCRSSGRSARAAELLAAQGFTRVHNLVGGMQAWTAAGLPTARRNAGR